MQIKNTTIANRLENLNNPNASGIAGDGTTPIDYGYDSGSEPSPDTTFNTPYTPPKKGIVQKVLDGYNDFRNKAVTTLGHFTDPITEGTAAIMGITGLADLINKKPYLTALREQITGNGPQADLINASKKDSGQFSGNLAYSAAEGLALGAAGSAGTMLASAGAPVAVSTAGQIAGTGVNVLKTSIDTTRDVQTITHGLRNNNTGEVITGALGTLFDAIGAIGTVKSGAQNIKSIKEAPSIKNTVGYAKGTSKLMAGIKPSAAVEDATKAVDYNKKNIEGIQDTIIEYTQPGFVPKTPAEKELKNAVDDMIANVKQRKTDAFAPLQRIVKAKADVLDEQISNILTNDKSIFLNSNLKKIAKDVARKLAPEQTKYTEQQIYDAIIAENTKFFNTNSFNAKELWDNAINMSKNNYEAIAENTLKNANKQFAEALKEEVIKKSPAITNKIADYYGLLKTASKDVTATKAVRNVNQTAARENAPILDAKFITSFQHALQNIGRAVNPTEANRNIKQGILNTIKASGTDFMNIAGYQVSKTTLLKALGYTARAVDLKPQNK